MGVVLSVVAVAVVATFSGTLAVPFGILIGLHPLLVYAVVAATAIAVTWTLLLSERLRTAVRARSRRGNRTGGHTERVVDRYGPIGLGLVGPLFPGVVASSILGVGLGVDRNHLGFWLMVGIGLWFGVFTVIWWAVREGLLG